MTELSSKELFKIFKTAPWQSTQEFEQFLQSLPPVNDLKLIRSMLDAITGKGDSINDVRHDMRVEIFRRLAAPVADPSLFSPLVKAIKQGDSKLKEVAASLIPKNNSIREHPKLIALLKSDDRPVRRAAQTALKQVGGKTLLQTLIQIIEDKDFTDRTEAMDLIVPMATYHAIPVLAKVLEVGRSSEKLKALTYLADVRYMQKAPKPALEAIVPALHDKNESIAAQAMIAFSSLATEDDYWEYVGPMLDDRNLNLVRAAVSGLKRFDSPRVLLTLEKKMRMGPSVIRQESLNVMEAIGNDSILPLLAEALGHTDMQVRKQAGDVLSRLSNSRKVDVARTIIWLLNSQNVHVRRMAVEVARSVKDPNGELWPRMLVMLRDEDWWVRERVMDALVDMAGRQLTPHMVHMLRDANDVMRRFAVDVLGRLKDEKALGALIQTAREDTDWWAKEKAVEAIAQLGDQRAVNYVVDLMMKDPDLQLCCLSALQALNARQTASYVAQMLTAKDPDVREAAVECLGHYNAAEFAEKLQPLIADESPRVARTAQQQLVRWNVALAERFTDSRDKAVSFLDRMLMAVVQGQGDDLILCSDRQPYMKRMGKTVSISPSVLNHSQIMALLTPHLSLIQMEELEQMRDADFSYEVKSTQARFRANVFRNENGYGAVFRTINAKAPQLSQLGLPDVVNGFGDKKWGLILVGGPTGSGKSTTLGAIIDYVNTNYDRHIITIEDPIEVVHLSKKGLVTQRELGTHARSTASALRATLREDPDVILVGEMRDLETIQFAVNAAETGHLVFGTLHTVSADTSIDRIINAYPAKEQDQVRATLADNLQAVICQHLIRRKDKQGRVVAAEVLLNTGAVANLIRSGKTYQIPSVITTSRDLGMQSMDTELLRLYKSGVITAEDVYMKANSKKEVEDLMSIEDEKAKKQSEEGPQPTR
ncbi:MAG: PilT/PilU family type 4a pilus ATPase [Deltaproteobacteria bacterium]|nr:PilT/PilU family type 4a pilus ATPase [Deltaproteobacteria bacterium]MBN2671797.1 PilT/PilU family type 4a pilus ATPase [Deltaproteobacteria bacterium]